MAGTDEKGGLGADPYSDPAAATRDPLAVPTGKRKTAAARRADPDQLAADIERTREELAETFDAIAEKVSPKRVAKRTSKRVAAAVRDTAAEAAASVRDTAVTAKDKVVGGSKDGLGWAPDPGPAAVPAPAAAAPLPTVAGDAALRTYTSSGSALRPQYVAAGVTAAVLAWLLLRRRT